MKYDILSVVDSQYGHVELEFDLRNDLTKWKELLTIPQMEREDRESDAEILGIIDDIKAEIEEVKLKHETPVPLGDCVLPRVAIVRVVEKDRNHLRNWMGKDADNHFLFIAEVAQAKGHVVIISQLSQKTYTMVHTEYLEIVPPQEC
jgi:hypothetical protein